MKRAYTELTNEIVSDKFKLAQVHVQYGVRGWKTLISFLVGFPNYSTNDVKVFDYHKILYTCCRPVQTLSFRAV